MPTRGPTAPGRRPQEALQRRKIPREPQGPSSTDAQDQLGDFSVMAAAGPGSGKRASYRLTDQGAGAMPDLNRWHQEAPHGAGQPRPPGADTPAKGPGGPHTTTPDSRPEIRPDRHSHTREPHREGRGKSTGVGCHFRASFTDCFAALQMARHFVDERA